MTKAVGCFERAGRADMPIVDYAALSEFGMRPGIKGKWIAAREHGASTLSVLWNLVEPDTRVPRHYHGYEEVIVVEEGRIWVSLGEDTVYATPGRAAIVPPNQIHAWGNDGPGVVRVLFIWPVLEPFAPGRSTYVEGAPPRVS
jgi:quercetin dioxygenase-like cupin family protein